MKMDAAPPDEAAVATPAPVLPRRRDPGAAAPDYKLWPDKFSVELHHDGFFCGLGRNRTYLSGKVEFFDECDKETWCQDAVDYMMMALGYKGGWKGDVYWLPPGKTLADVLKLHILHKHSREMAAASAFYKNLVLYIDHVSLLASQPVPDDTVICGTPLTDVVTPVIKREDDTVICGTPLPDGVSPAIKREARVLNDEGGYQANSEASDSDLVDSDYSLKESDSDGDDSDYEKAVDSDVQDELMGKKIDEDDWSDEAAEDFDLELPHDEDERKINFKTRTFVAETEMQNPVFKLLLAFSSMKEAREALREYAIKERVQIRKKRNNATRLEAICEGVAPEGPCSWKLVVSEDNREDKFVVKEYEGEHTCERVWNVREMSYTYLAKRFVDEFVGNENLSLKAFAKTIQKEVNMRPSRFKLAKAKYKALEKIHGDEKEQFNSLWDYGEELRFTNPGTSFYLELRFTNLEENERGTKISKHGVKMHCSYCRSPHHTKRNCEEYKSDLANGIAFADPPKKKPAEQQPVPVDGQAPAEQEPVPPEDDRVPEQHVLVDNEVPEQEHVSVDNQVPEQESMPVNVEKRKRKPSRKKKEQEEAEKEYEARKKKAVVFDENGDIDDPTILAHITTKKLVPSHDPTQLQDSVVFQLQQEFSTRKTVVREEMPEESSYVAEQLKKCYSSSSSSGSACN